MAILTQLGGIAVTLLVSLLSFHIPFELLWGWCSGAEDLCDTAGFELTGSVGIPVALEGTAVSQATCVSLLSSCLDGVSLQVMSTT